MKEEWVDIVKQENVPALLDNSANVAVDENEFKIVTKPHGHGDIHTLLYQHNVHKKWLDLGKQWLVFIQDTNAPGLMTIPSVLGVSRKFNFEMNSITVPRKPGQAMGAICKLVDQQDDSKEIVINVEYNQLDPLLKAKWNPAGDVADQNGYSSFPGNTNTLVFKLKEYVENLDKTMGVIPEFVNPKYADEERNRFKAPTRLECMMQDYPKLITSKSAVGFTSFDTWFCFSPAKNNLKDGALLQSKGLPTATAGEAEWDIYNWANNMLEIAGVKVERESEVQEYGGINLKFGPKVFIDPSFALTLSELRSKFTGQVSISKSSSLFLSGKDVYIGDAVIDGYLKTQNGDGNVSGSYDNKLYHVMERTREEDEE